MRKAIFCTGHACLENMIYDLYFILTPIFKFSCVFACLLQRFPHSRKLPQFHAQPNGAEVLSPLRRSLQVTSAHPIPHQGRVCCVR